MGGRKSGEFAEHDAFRSAIVEARWQWLGWCGKQIEETTLRETNLWNSMITLWGSTKITLSRIDRIWNSILDSLESEWKFSRIHWLHSIGWAGVEKSRTRSVDYQNERLPSLTLQAAFHSGTSPTAHALQWKSWWCFSLKHRESDGSSVNELFSGGELLSSPQNAVCRSSPQALAVYPVSDI